MLIEKLVSIILRVKSYFDILTPVQNQSIQKKDDRVGKEKKRMKELPIKIKKNSLRDYFFKHSFEIRTGPAGQPGSGTGPDLSKNPFGSWSGETWATGFNPGKPGLSTQPYFFF